MKIFIVGGTGFLGYYSTLEALSRGHKVATCSLPDIELGDWFPKEVKVEYKNIFQTSEKELIKLFEGYDAMVYSVGPDDRIIPDAPAEKFFHDKLVIGCTKVVEAAKKAGVKKCVVLGSYFCYFNKIWPEKKLEEKHAYIKARMLQEESVINAGENSMNVCVLELPYIFGSMPERTPIWKELLVDMLIEKEKIYFPKGGTVMISAKAVGEAVIGAVENGEHGKCYPIGDVNMSWNEMLGIMLKELGLDKKIHNLPKFVSVLYGVKMKLDNKKLGKEAGLNPIYLMRDIQTNYLYYDDFGSKKELGYSGGDIEKAISETIKACEE